MDLGWVSFSRTDTNKMLGLLDSLRIPGAVDEIGIGVIRDGFADIFFPGTSTIQTRAKYFILIPYILKEQCEEHVYSKDKLCEEQIRFTEVLLNNSKNSIRDEFEDDGGIIGSRIMSEKWLSKKMDYKREHWLARTPAEIYWSGLREFKIFNGDLLNYNNISFPVYLSSSFEIKKTLDENKKNEQINKRKKNKDDSENAIMSLWDFSYKRKDNPVHIENIYRKDWNTDGLKVDLTPQEADYLSYKIIDSNKHSLFSYILQNDIEVLDSSENYLSFEELSKKCTNWKHDNGLLELANNFNDLVYRLRLRYNIELFKECEGFTWPLEEWERIATTKLKITKEQIDQIFTTLHIGNKYDYLKAFLTESIDLLTMPTEQHMELLGRKLEEHEIKIKKSTARSKLYNKDIEPPSGDSLIGGSWLDFRFHSAARIICDIRKPVE